MKFQAIIVVVIDDLSFWKCAT